MRARTYRPQVVVFIAAALALPWLGCLAPDADAGAVTTGGAVLKGEEMSTSTKSSKEKLQERLTPIQYKVTQQDGTEPPFQNEYWDNKEPGIYVDVVSGEPLFSSLDKYDSGTGWPSFTRPLEEDNVATKTDFKLLYPRTEVRSADADSHLGHVFKDGPEPTGLRYCMNSAALRFVPVEDLEKDGYGKFLELFEDEAAASDE